MDDEFEIWARSEISRLRADADQMECVLARFLASRGSASVVLERQASPAAINHTRQSTPHSPRAMSSGKRVSKNEPIFKAFEKAGAAGMDMDDVERVARESGLNTNRNALRALCWNGKQIGRLISIEAGRYAIAQTTEAADSPMNEGSAAPAREPHDQHREGDAGGGT